MTVKIITAEQAAELAVMSNEMVTWYLERIGKAIEVAARSGKRSLALSSVVEFAGQEHVSFSKPAHGVNRHADFQKLLISALEKFNYTAELKAIGEQYVPRALQDDDGNGPLYQNFTIVVSW